jgi:bacteriocin-like protein
MRNQIHELSIDDLDQVSGGGFVILPAPITITGLGPGSNFPGGPPVPMGSIQIPGFPPGSIFT